MLRGTAPVFMEDRMKKTFNVQVVLPVAQREQLEDLVEEINEEKGHGGKTWTISGWCRYSVMKALVAKDKPQPQFQA